MILGSFGCVWGIFNDSLDMLWGCFGGVLEVFGRRSSPEASLGANTRPSQAGELATLAWPARLGSPSLAGQTWIGSAYHGMDLQRKTAGQLPR